MTLAVDIASVNTQETQTQETQTPSPPATTSRGTQVPLPLPATSPSPTNAELVEPLDDYLMNTIMKLDQVAQNLGISLKVRSSLPQFVSSCRVLQHCSGTSPQVYHNIEIVPQQYLGTSTSGTRFYLFVGQILPCPLLPCQWPPVCWLQQDGWDDWVAIMYRGNVAQNCGEVWGACQRACWVVLLSSERSHQSSKGWQEMDCLFWWLLFDAGALFEQFVSHSPWF